MWMIALSPLAGFMVAMLVYIVVAHLTARILAALATGAAIGACAMAGLIAAALTGLAATTGEIIGWWATALFAYLALLFCFWATINLIATSLRIRILREVHDAPGRHLPLRQLDALYNAGTVVEARIERLAALQHLRIEAERVTLARQTLVRVGRIIAWLRSAIIPGS